MTVCTLCEREIINPLSAHRLDCRHAFHTSCLLEYFETHRKKCPTCRRRLSYSDREYFDALRYGEFIVVEDDYPIDDEDEADDIEVIDDNDLELFDDSGYMTE